MKPVNKVSVQFYFKASICSKFLWPLLSLAVFYSGCSNNYKDTTQPSTSTESAKIEVRTPILIKAKESQLNVRPSLIDQTLVLGDSRIEHWPLELPICQQCNLEIERVFYPDGPNTLLVLKNINTNYQWGILQSGQKQVHLLGTKLFFDEQGTLNIIRKNKDKDKDKVILQSGKSLNYDNCNITPLWIEKIKPMSSDYSDDQAKYKIQIFFECQS